jgi:hypothetical protein
MKRICWSVLVGCAFALAGCEGCGGDVVVEPGTGGAGGWSETSGTMESSGSGTGGSSECFPCARMLDDAGFESSKLCPEAVALHAALTSCVCGGPCPACDDQDFCDGFFMSGLCSPCAEQVCASQMAACLADNYPPD